MASAPAAIQLFAQRSWWELWACWYSFPQWGMTTTNWPSDFSEDMALSMLELLNSGNVLIPINEMGISVFSRTTLSQLNPFWDPKYFILLSSNVSFVSESPFRPAFWLWLLANETTSTPKCFKTSMLSGGKLKTILPDAQSSLIGSLEIGPSKFKSTKSLFVNIVSSKLSNMLTSPLFLK